MKKFRDLKLNAKFMLTIGLILVVLTIADVWFSMRKEKEIMRSDIQKWTFVLAEEIRTTLNTLMREGQMGIRFAMLETMNKEVKGLNNLKIIRSPKVDEIFKSIRDKELLPKEQAAIERFKEKLSKLQEDLKKAKGKDERNDILDDIGSINRNIEKSKESIKASEIHVDEREKPKDALDWEVINTGKPIYRLEGDKARVLVPYISHKNSCSTNSGCHKYANDGDVLGAISMEFSVAEVNQEITANNLKTAGLGAVRLIIVLGVLAFFLSYLIIRNINTMLTAFKRFAGGDFTAKLPVDGKDEMCELASGFNSLTEEFGMVIKEIRGASLTLASAAEELSASSSQIAKGMDSQKTSTTQVSVSSEELSGTINEVAKNSLAAADAAKNASDLAHKGGKVVAGAVMGMHNIAPIVKDTADVMVLLGKRSNEIGQIIQVINDIADQTNLLALNAAIEAARAGEQGRGFAVVADEVRKLADRTTNATKEIGETIKSIQRDTEKAMVSNAAEVKAVEEAVNLASEAGSVLEEIVAHVSRVSSMMHQIATASEQQSIAANQISEDVEAVANVTKGTVNDVTQVANAANELSLLSSRLEQLTSRFKVQAGGRAAEPDANIVPVGCRPS